MVLNRERVLASLRQKGPSVPTELTSDLGENSFIVGAFLSELVAQKMVKMTTAKIGGSCLYFTPEHHQRIVRLREHLNEKDRTAYDVLAEKKVVRDDTLTPLLRTCMRNLPDFALPVKVKFQGQEILFWRWFLTNQEETQQVIEKELSLKKETIVSDNDQDIIVENKQPIPSTQSTSPTPQTNATIINNTNNTNNTEPLSVPSMTFKHINNPQSSDVSADAFLTVKKEMPSEEKHTGRNNNANNTANTTNNANNNTTTNNNNEKQSTPEHTQKKPPSSLSSHEHDPLFLSLVPFLKEKNISVSDVRVLRAKSELEMTVRVSSSVGSLTYYARVKKKKTCNEGDIAVAAVQGQMKNLPVLFMTSGKLAKKTAQLVNKQYPMVTIVEDIPLESGE